MTLQRPQTPPAALDADVHVHVPTPGDHYSPSTGSAIMTIIYQMARHHRGAGGETRVVVSRGTRQDYDVGTCIEVAERPLPGRQQKLIDMTCGRLGLPRHFGEATYRPASNAIQRHFAGPILVHNNPVALRMLKARHPHAQVFLWANNVLFRTYSRSEIQGIARTVDGLICCSDFIANDLAARMGRTSERIHVVRNGADTEQFRPNPQRNENTEPVVLFVGRVVPEKGPDLLLKAASRLVTRKRRFKVRIVGSSGFTDRDPLTPYEQELRRLAAGLGDRVEFQPFVDRARVAGMYAEATIFCVPSNWDDPCPLTVAEGMACGLPMVASRRGGIPEMGGDAVLYFQPPDVDTLAEHLEALLDSVALRVEMGHRARMRAEATRWEVQYRALRRALGSV